MTQISVITPTYNRADVLPRAIESVISQSFNDFEYIIVDDGSDDDTKSVVKSYDDDRIKYIFQENQGANVARNLGIDQSSGKYISFLDSDDEYLPKRLETVVNTLEGTEYVGACHRYTIIDENGVARSSSSPTGEITIEDLRRRNPIGTISSTTFTRKIIEQVNGLDTEFPSSQDYELYIRVLTLGSMIGIPDILAKYYRRADSISADPERKATAQELLWQKHSEKLSDDLRARQAYTLGHGYATIGKMNEAKSCFKESFYLSPNFLVGYHYILSVLGKDTFEKGMKLKTFAYSTLNNLSE